MCGVIQVSSSNVFITDFSNLACFHSIYLFLFIKLRPTITHKEKEKDEEEKEKKKENRQQNKTKWPGEPLQLSQLQRPP